MRNNFQYHIQTFNSNVDMEEKVTHELNMLGKQGWELVSVINSTLGASWNQCFFKRKE